MISIALQDRLIRTIDKTLNHAISRTRLKSMINKGLPLELAAVAQYLINQNTTSKVEAISQEIEKRRESLIKSTDSRSVPIIYSPKPGSTTLGEFEISEIRPNHGELLEFSIAQVAKTGKNKRWATAIHILAQQYQASMVLELGACAGISAAYLASVDSVAELTTIEGSKELADIATATLSNFTNANVINALFEDALNSYLPTKKNLIDFVYIDGHHEKVATIHYFEKILPYLANESIIVFDDIRWSKDMHDGWCDLISHPSFRMTCDLGSIGIAQTSHDRASHAEQKHWDLSNILGHTKIGNPHGWKD